MSDVFNTSTIHKINGPTYVNCSANSSQPCHYSWYDQSNESNEMLAIGQSVFIDKPGSYRCVAKCTIRGQTCEILPAVVNFSGTGSVLCLLQDVVTVDLVC